MSPSTAALSGNLPFPEGLIGFEPATRAMRLVLLDQINAEITAQNSRWSRADIVLQSLGLDVSVGQIDLEPVTPANLHEGPHESLLKASMSRFPNISVHAYLTQPVAGSGFGDQVDSNQLTLAVETMVKAGPVPSDGLSDTAFETIVHRRIQRTTEAVNAVFRRNPTMYGTVAMIAAPPLGGIGKVSWVQREKDTGDRFMWQGSRLQYVAQRASTFR